MQKVIFDDNWKDYFADFSLSSFEDFFYCTAGRVINKNDKRNVSVFTLAQNPGSEKVFFIKRFHNPHLKDKISAFATFGKPTSQAELEWKNARLLLNNGIETYRPVCFGRLTKLGMEKKSFLITEKLDSIEFIEFLSLNWASLKRHQQEKIITAAAKLIRKAHKLDITLPDFSVWHLFICPDSIDTEPQLSVIDLHRMRHDVKNQNKKIKDLGRFFWSMSPKYFDENHKDLFITVYAGQNPKYPKDALAEKIRKRTEILLKRNTPKDY